MAKSQPRNYSNLPISKYKDEILNKLQTNQVVIIIGETGCGKSTQVPMYLHDAGYTNKKIVCLHPRCVAATTLAERVFKELRIGNIGEFVGYAIRFEIESSHDTKIMFVTTGSMIRYIMSDIKKLKGHDKWVEKYSVIIIDEAHERSIETDIMLGKMKQVMETNKEIKLIIMSATIDIAQFQQYYPGSETVIITEKMELVTVIYKPLRSYDYLTEIENLVKDILKKPGNGHILIFLPSENSVMSCFNRLKPLRNVKVLSFFACMDISDKKLVFYDFCCRKIIVATNAAESGLTIPDLEYVIDSGAVRKVIFNHETWTEAWITNYVSIAEADQRKGRTGRTRSGFCYRLFEESFMRTFDENDSTNLPDYDIKFPYIRKDKSIDISNKYFHQFPEPTIHEVNLGTMILIIKSFGYNNIMTFPFFVRPYEDKIESAVKQLCNLSILSDDKTLSRLGRQVRFLPLEPRIGKVAYLGSRLQYREDILILISILSVRRLLKSLQRASYSLKKYRSKEGDIFCYLNLYKEARKKNFNENWCTTNSISYHDIIYGSKVFNQLKKSLPRVKLPEEKCPESKIELIKKVFLTAYFQNIAKPFNINEKEEDDSIGNSHKTFDGRKVLLHRESCLTESTEMVIFQSIYSYLDSSKLLLLNCISIDKELLLSIDPIEWEINVEPFNRILNYFIDN